MGVNKYKLDKEQPVEVLHIDNRAVIQAQRAKLREVYSQRDDGEVASCLNALTDCAVGKGGNLLDLSIKVHA